MHKLSLLKVLITHLFGVDGGWIFEPDVLFFSGYVFLFCFFLLFLSNGLWIFLFD